MQERWPSVEEIAARLGVNRDTIYQRLVRKKMSAHKVGCLWKFLASEVDAWVNCGASYQTYISQGMKIEGISIGEVVTALSSAPASPVPPGGNGFSGVHRHLRSQILASAVTSVAGGCRQLPLQRSPSARLDTSRNARG